MTDSHADGDRKAIKPETPLANLPVTTELKATLLELEASNAEFSPLFMRHAGFKRHVQFDLRDFASSDRITFENGDFVVVATHGKIIVDLLNGTCATVRDGTSLIYNDPYTGKLTTMASFSAVTISGAKAEQYDMKLDYNLARIGSVVGDWDWNIKEYEHFHPRDLEVAEKVVKKKLVEVKRKGKPDAPPAAKSGSSSKKHKVKRPRLETSDDE